MTAFSPSLHGAMEADNRALLQSHDLAVAAALQALQLVADGVARLASTGAAASADDLAWRVDLLEDVTAGANDLAVLIEAALAG